MTGRNSGYGDGQPSDSGGQETGDGTSSSGQSGSVGDPSNDAGAVNLGDAGDSASGNSDGEEGGGPGTR